MSCLRPAIERSMQMKSFYVVVVFFVWSLLLGRDMFLAGSFIARVHENELRREMSIFLSDVYFASSEKRVCLLWMRLHLRPVL